VFNIDKCGDILSSIVMYAPNITHHVIDAKITMYYGSNKIYTFKRDETYEKFNRLLNKKINNLSDDYYIIHDEHNIPLIKLNEIDLQCTITLDKYYDNINVHFEYGYYDKKKKEKYIYHYIQ